jgi:hypothetical protein
VRLWDSCTAACLGALRSARRYEGVDITGLTGITEAQRQALTALGSVVRPGGASASRDSGALRPAATDAETGRPSQIRD